MAVDFKNLTIDYKTLLKNTSISDRVQLTKSRSGQQLLTTLTPTQIAGLFPDYYKRSDPDVSGFVQATSRRYAGKGGGTAAGVAPGTQYTEEAGKGGRTGQGELGGLGVGRRTGGRTSPSQAEPSILKKLIAATGDEKYGKYISTGVLSDAGIDKIIKITGRLETGNRGSENVSNDTEGSKSYGRLGLNTRGPVGTRSIDTFLSQNPQFKNQLTAKPGSAEFDQQWRDLARSNPEALAQAERSWYKDNVISGTQARMTKAGIPENMAQDPRVIAYFADREIQQGKGSTNNSRTPGRISDAIKLSGNDPEKFLKEFSRIDSSKEAMEADIPNALRTGVYGLPGHQNRISGRLTGSLGMGAEDVVPQGDSETAKNALPQGIDTRIIQQYRSISPDQRDEFASKITQDVEKMGGVDKFNDKFSRKETTKVESKEINTGPSGIFEDAKSAKDYLRQNSTIGSSANIMKQYGYNSISSLNDKTSVQFANAIKEYNDYADKNNLPRAGLTSAARHPLPGMPGGMRNKENSQHTPGFAGDVVFYDKQGNQLPLNKGPHDVFGDFATKQGLYKGSNIYGQHETHHYQSHPGKNNPYTGPEYFDDMGRPKDPNFLREVDPITGKKWTSPAEQKQLEQQTQVPAQPQAQAITPTATPTAPAAPKYMMPNTEKLVNQIYDNPGILPADKAEQLESGKKMPFVSEKFIKEKIKGGLEEEIKGYKEKGFNIGPGGEITHQDPSKLKELPNYLKVSDSTATGEPASAEVAAAALGDTIDNIEDPGKLSAVPINEMRDTGGRENVQLRYEDQPLVNVNSNEKLQYDSDKNKLEITPQTRTRPEDLAETKKEDQQPAQVQEQRSQEPLVNVNNPERPRTKAFTDIPNLSPISYSSTDTYRRMETVNEKFGFGSHYGYAGINS